MLWCTQVTETELSKQTSICSVVWHIILFGEKKKKKKTVQAILLTAGNSSFLSPSGLVLSSCKIESGS